MEVILQLPCQISGVYRYNPGQIILHQPLSLWIWKLWGIPFAKLITPSKTNMTRKKWLFLMRDTSSSSCMYVFSIVILLFGAVPKTVTSWGDTPAGVTSMLSRPSNLKQHVLHLSCRWTKSHVHLHLQRGTEMHLQFSGLVGGWLNQPIWKICDN